MNTISSTYRRNKYAIIVLLSSLLIIITIYCLLKVNQNTQINDTISKTSELLKQSLEKDIASNSSLIEKLADKWQKDQGMSYNLWLLAAGEVVSLNPSLKAIQWVDKNYLVRWIQPLLGHSEGLNVDLSQDPKLNNKLNYARDNKLTIASDIVHLQNGQKAVLTISPIYEKDSFKGFMIGIFPVKNLLKYTLDQKIYKDYLINLYEHNSLIYSNNSLLKTHKFLYNLQYNQKINILNQKWHAKIIPSQRAINNIKNWLPELVLIMGLIFSCLMSLLIFYLNLYQKSNAHLKLLKNSVRSISENSEFDITLKECIEYLSQTLRWDIGHAYLVNPSDNNTLVPSNIWYLKNKQKLKNIRRVLDKKSFNIGEGLPGKVLESGHPVWITQDLDNIILADSKQTGHSVIKAALGIPIKYMGQTAIVLGFYNCTKLQYDNDIVELIDTLSAELSTAYSKKQTDELWKRLALRDNLTQFMNFKTFYSQINEELFLAKRYNYNIAVITINIDNFKEINDEHGFEIGNETLKIFSSKSLELIKNQGYISRYTGKKFGILLPKIETEDEVFKFVKKIHYTLTQSIQVKQYCITLKLRIGYKISNKNDNADKMIKYSDPLLPNNNFYT